MRIMSIAEIRKRGCKYCLDYKRIRGMGRMCKHDECPHHELDEFETYEDYFKSKPSINIEKILKRGWK